MAQRMAFAYHAVVGSPDDLKPGTWYLISPEDESMSPATRVGASAIFVPNLGKRGKLVLSGGSDVDGTYGDLHELRTDIEYFQWFPLPSEGMVARYEHALFLLDGELYCFGGAEEKGPFNDLLKYNPESGLWVAVETTGPAPSPRTYHFSGTTGVVYSGGYMHTTPVSDTKIYFFNAANAEWSSPATTGSPPCPRQGHIIAIVGNRLFLHGGMSGSEILDDLHVLNLDTYEWSQPEVSGTPPPPLAAHGCAVIGTKLYSFGGLCPQNKQASNDLYCFDTDTMSWAKAVYSGERIDPPAPRIDHAMCTIQLPVKKRSSHDNESSTGDESIKQETEECQPSSPLNSPAALEVAGVSISQASTDTTSSGGTVAQDGNTKSGDSKIITVLEPDLGTQHSLTSSTESSSKSVSEVAVKLDTALTVSSSEDGDDGSTEYVTALFVHGGVNSSGMIFGDCFLFIPQD